MERIRLRQASSRDWRKVDGLSSGVRMSAAKVTGGKDWELVVGSWVGVESEAGLGLVGNQWRVKCSWMRSGWWVWRWRRDVGVVGGVMVRLVTD
jgi:hypothetical protein